MLNAYLCGRSAPAPRELRRVLSGWKEVAQYLGRGVRTVQRWENLGLPVRRPNSRLRSAIVCRTDELDAWIASCATGRNMLPVATNDGAPLVRAHATRVAVPSALEADVSALFAEEISSVEKLLATVRQLQSENNALKQQLATVTNAGRRKIAA